MLYTLNTKIQHVAVCMCYVKNEEHHIELFDAARGDAKFSLNDQNTSLAKKWLAAYFESYEKRGCELNISSFSLKWMNSCSSAATMCKQSNDSMLSPALAQNPHTFFGVMPRQNINRATEHQQNSSATATYTPQH